MGKIANLSGRRFGNLLVVDMHSKSNSRNYHWRCLCDCGSYTIVRGGNLTSGVTKSCGCLKNRTHKEIGIDLSIDYRGKKIGRLLVLERVGINKKRRATWNCLCDCGNTIIVDQRRLSGAGVHSCGCYIKEIAPSKNKLKLEYGVSSLNSIFYSYRMRAQKKGLPFDFTMEMFKSIIDRNCFYCGMPPSNKGLGDKNSNGSYPHSGLDRLDNSLGYTEDNCVPCCKKCNYAKNTDSFQNHVDWIRKTYMHLKKGGIICD